MCQKRKTRKSEQLTHAKIRIAGVVLAGGESRRMGREKASLPIPYQASQTFLDRAIENLRPHCSEVVVVVRERTLASDDHSSFPRFVADLVPGQGPLMGLLTGLQAISTTHAFVTAVDTPYLQSSLISLLLCQADIYPDQPIIPIVDSIPQVLLALYPTSLLPLVQTLLVQGRRDLRALLDQSRPHYLPETEIRLADPELRSFLNFNTPADLECYRLSHPSLPEQEDEEQIDKR